MNIKEKYIADKVNAIDHSKIKILSKFFPTFDDRSTIIGFIDIAQEILDNHDGELFATYNGGDFTFYHRLQLSKKELDAKIAEVTLLAEEDFKKELRESLGAYALGEKLTTRQCEFIEYFTAL